MYSIVLLTAVAITNAAPTQVASPSGNRGPAAICKDGAGCASRGSFAGHGWYSTCAAHGQFAGYSGPGCYATPGSFAGYNGYGSYATGGSFAGYNGYGCGNCGGWIGYPRKSSGYQGAR